VGVFNLDRSAKAIFAGVFAFATAIATGYDDSVLTNSEKALAVGAGITALGAVWAFANPLVKAILAGVVAGVAALGLALKDDMVSAQEWVTIAVAFLGAIAAVYRIDNTDSP